MVERSELRVNGKSPMKSRLGALLLAFGLLLLAFAFQGSRGIFALDEGVHVGIAQAMRNT